MICVTIVPKRYTKECCVLRLWLHEENCRGRIEVFVKITCFEENIILGKAHRRPCWKGAYYVAMLERSLNSDESNKREQNRKAKEKRTGVNKVGGAIT